MGVSKNDLKDILIENNIKPSHHRLRILEYLYDNKLHPTVETIYNSLVDEIPTLSKTTVYNTLNVFVQSNIVKVLMIDDAESRYDIAIENHGHFKCNLCKEIYDFPIKEEDLLSEQLENFYIHTKNVYFNGICPKCR